MDVPASMHMLSRDDDNTQTCQCTLAFKLAIPQKPADAVSMKRKRSSSCQEVH